MRAFFGSLNWKEPATPAHSNRKVDALLLVHAAKNLAASFKGGLAAVARSSYA